MDESDFEGSLVLERLAEAGLIDAFFAAVDSDDFEKARRLMTRSGIDAETIQTVLRKIADADGKH